jgi:hypothetical protein
MGLATVASSYIVADRGQDLTNTVTLATAQSIVGWDVSANLYSYAGGPILATGTVTATNTATGVWSIAWSGEDLDLQGLYCWDFWRTDTGSQAPIVDVSGFQIRQSGELGGPTLTNFSEYMAFLGMTGTITDTFLRQTLQLLGAAESALTNAIGRKLTYDPDIVEYFDSWPDGGIQLRRQPVWCINEVKVDQNGGYGQIPDTFGEDTIVEEGNYSIDLNSFRNDGASYSGILRFNNYNQQSTLPQTLPWGWASDGSFGSAYNRSWATLTKIPMRLPGCIQVTYAAGYQLVPEDVKLAVFTIVRDRLNIVSRGASFVSESGEGYSYSLGPYTDEEKKLGSVQMVVNNYRSAEMLLG